MTTLPPTMPLPPTHRGGLDLAAGVAGQSHVGRTDARPRGLSQYVRPVTGALAIGGRFSRFLGARAIGELALGGDQVDAYDQGLIASGRAGRLGGSLDVGYTSEDEPLHASLSLEMGMHVTVMHRLYQVDARRCSGVTEDTCTPWAPTAFPILSGIEVLPYVRVTGLVGYTIAPALRVFTQGSLGTTPRLEGSGGAPTISQTPVVGLELGLEVSYDALSLVVTGGWSSESVFEHGPRVSAALRLHLGDGPGSTARRDAGACRARARETEREHSVGRPFEVHEDRASAYGPAPAAEPRRGCDE